MLVNFDRDVDAEIGGVPRDLLETLRRDLEVTLASVAAAPLRDGLADEIARHRADRWTSDGRVDQLRADLRREDNRIVEPLAVFDGRGRHGEPTPTTDAHARHAIVFQLVPQLADAFRRGM